MHKLVLHRWVLVFLVLMRLVVGELAHAMPMTAMTSSKHTASAQQDPEDPVACPEHEAGMSANSAGHPPVSESTEAPASHDCCKTGECECPCLHVPCAALDAAIAPATHLELHRIPGGIQGLMLQQPSRLFRPPA